MLAEGISPSVVHNNCSGKHTGMLALARMLQAPLAGYHLPDHPVQRTILEHVAMMCGIKTPETIYTGVDGCGVPTFYLPLERMAYAYARLVDPRGLDTTSQGAAMLISEAIRMYPEVISGTGRLEVTLAEATGHRLVSKGGAEAVFCLGIPERGLGIAVKMADGVSRTIGPLVSAILAEIGVLNDQEIQNLAPVINPVIKNHAGREVGFMKPVFRLNRGKL
jgi:L-asparaginase II